MIHCLEKTQKVTNFVRFNFNFWELYYSKFDFLICSSDRSQCFEYHGMVDFAYKL